MFLEKLNGYIYLAYISAPLINYIDIWYLCENFTDRNTLWIYDSRLVNFYGKMTKFAFLILNSKY
jgi:hypothetical protein